jgi:DNA-binding CsgD family transcriptional regulator
VRRDGCTLAVDPVGARPSALLLRETVARPSAAGLRSLGLTPREADVLTLLADGKRNEEIARLLSVSPRTVKKHLESVYAKLGVHTRAAAVAVALTSS